MEQIKHWLTTGLGIFILPDEEEDVKQVTELLLQSVQHAPQRGERGRAALALAKLVKPESIPALTYALQNDKDTFVRECAVEALVTIAYTLLKRTDQVDPKIITALGDAIHDDNDNIVRAKAVRAIDGIIRLGGPQSQCFQLLLHAINTDKSAEVRMFAAIGLGYVDGILPIPALIRVMQDDPDDTVKRHAVWSLGGIQHFYQKLIGSAGEDRKTAEKVNELVIPALKATLPTANGRLRAAIESTLADAHCL